MNPRSNSKFATIKAYLSDKIASGEWPENTPVPSENKLAAQFTVSRMTARRALQDLTKQGLLCRTQGAATVVACLKSQNSVLEIHNISDEIKARSHQYSCRVVTLTEMAAPVAVANAFSIKVGDPVYFSQLIHFENQIPLQLESRFVDPAIACDYLKQDFSQLTPHEYLSQIAPLSQAEHLIQAILPESDSQNLLEITANEPCLRLTRTTWSQIKQTQQVVSFTYLTYPGSRYQLGSKLSFDSPSKSKENI